ncbi:MAG: CBS domain-containing protein [Phycisphaeraceae bacterium]
MATMMDLLARKGMQVFSVSPDSSVRQAANAMNQHRVGGLVVVGSDDRLLGVFTERDVLRRVVAEGRDPALTPVKHVMTRDVTTIRPEQSVENARNAFASKRIRHLPVVDETGRLLGMISIGDVNAWMLDGQALELHYLHQYIATA